MADEQKRVIALEPEPDDPNAIKLQLCRGLASGEDWIEGASFHLEGTEYGYKLVRDNRPL